MEEVIKFIENQLNCVYYNICNCSQYNLPMCVGKEFKGDNFIFIFALDINKNFNIVENFIKDFKIYFADYKPTFNSISFVIRTDRICVTMKHKDHHNFFNDNISVEGIKNIICMVDGIYNTFNNINNLFHSDIISLTNSHRYNFSISDYIANRISLSFTFDYTTSQFSDIEFVKNISRDKKYGFTNNDKHMEYEFYSQLYQFMYNNKEFQICTKLPFLEAYDQFYNTSIKIALK
jgi:hypothetical protein